jgi:Tfp pilus assembly protein PilN
MPNQEPGGQFATFAKLLGRFTKRKTDSDGAGEGLDFLPEGYALRRRRRRTDAIMLTLLVVVLGVIFTTWHIGERSLLAAEAEYAEEQAAHAKEAQSIQQMRQMRSQQKTVADRMELTASLLERLPRSNLLAELTNALPHGVSLTQCKLDARRRAAPPPPKSAGKGKTEPQAQPPVPLAYDTELTLRGLAHTEGQVSDYVGSLAESTYFRSVDLRWVSLDKPRDGVPQMRTFMVGITLDPTAFVRKPLERRRPDGEPVASAD